MMGTIHLCLEVHCDYMRLYSRLDRSAGYQQALDAVFDSQYHQYYKLLQHLYGNPSCHISLSISGRHLDWLARNHREFLMVLSELANRRQVEILGGAYYNPLLPAILPVDRVGQIEMFTTALRRHTGKRPRGMVVPNNAWEPGLVSSLRTCSMDFVMMDTRLIPQDKRCFLPYIVQEQGKILYVLGQDQQLLPFSGDEGIVPPRDYLSRLEAQALAACSDTENPLVCCSLSLDQINKLLDDQWLQELDATVSQRQGRWAFRWTLPSRYIKDTQHFQRTYIPAGILLTEGRAAMTGGGTILNPYDYLLREPTTYRLYSKMMHVSLLVSQSRGDKGRRKLVRELLMEAQAGESYRPHLTEASLMSQGYACRCLLQAEKVVREFSGFFDSVTTYDYDADGLREYICQFQPFNAYIQRRGGSIFEFDVFHTFRNYAGSGTGLFLDYFLDDCSSPRDTAFSRQLYKERSFDGKRRDIQLVARGSVGRGGQPVSLKKNYVVSPDGILVQYIIKNEGDQPLRQVFAVESHLQLEAAGTDSLDTELICGQQEELQVFHSQLPQDRGRDVSQVRFSDQDLSFVFVLNEQATLKMRACDGSLLVSLCWQVDIPPQREVEKNISFTVMPRKPSKRLR